MNWKDIWMTLFGTADLFGLNMGFWVSMAVVALIVVVMNVNTKQKQTERIISRSVSCYPVPSGLPHRSHCVPMNMNRYGFKVFLGGE